MMYRRVPHDPTQVVFRNRPFKCEACDVKPDCPMLRDDVWASMGNTRQTLLCIRCAERKLGRPIKITDLNDSVANAFTFLLWDRILNDSPAFYASPEDILEFMRSNRGR